MMPCRDDWGSEAPCGLLFVAARDVVHRASVATSLGGHLVAAPTMIPDVGLFALVENPGGALFAISSLEGQVKRTHSALTSGTDSPKVSKEG